MMIAAAHLRPGDVIENPTPSDEPDRYDDDARTGADVVRSVEARSASRDPNGTRRFVRLRYGASRVWDNTRLFEVTRG